MLSFYIHTSTFPSLSPGNHQSVLHLHSFVILVETHSIRIGVLVLVFFAVLQGLWDLSFPTRDQTRAHRSKSAGF